jgi:hypothetical protein
LEGWSRGDFFQRSKPPFRAGISRWKKPSQHRNSRSRWISNISRNDKWVT